MLVTDTVATGGSFVCFYFKNIEWTKGGVSGRAHAQVDFDKGDNITSYSHPDSFSTNITDIGADGAPLC